MQSSIEEKDWAGIGGRIVFQNIIVHFILFKFFFLLHAHTTFQSKHFSFINCVWDRITSAARGPLPRAAAHCQHLTPMSTALPCRLSVASLPLAGHSPYHFQFALSTVGLT